MKKSKAIHFMRVLAAADASRLGCSRKEGGKQTEGLVDVGVLEWRICLLKALLWPRVLFTQVAPRIIHSP